MVGVPVWKVSSYLDQEGLPVSETAALYHLQSIDSQIDAARSRLSEISRLLSENEKIRVAQTTLQSAQTNYMKWKTRATDLELERGQLRDEASAAEERLYSGRVHNPRELTDLQSKIIELNQRHNSLEDPTLEAMMEVEEGEKGVKDAKTKLERVMAEQADALGALTTEQTELETKLAQLETQGNQIRGQLQPAHLKLYNDLRKRPGGIAVSALKRDECSVCGVQITSQQKQQIGHGQVVPCPTCGRILVVR
jgi:uncharacterized protein